MLWYLLMWRELLSIGALLHFSSQKMSKCSILLLKKYCCCVFTFVKKFKRLEFVCMLLDVLLYVSWITFFLKWLDWVWNGLLQPNIGIIVYYCFIFRYSNLSGALDVLMVLLLMVLAGWILDWKVIRISLKLWNAKLLFLLLRYYIHMYF